MNNKDLNQINSCTPNNFLIHEYYAKLPYWTKEKAVVILASSRDTHVSESFKRIRIMNRVTQDGNVFPILHLLERAIQHGKLPTKEQRDPNSSHFIKVFRPIDFIKWAKKKGIELPDGLEELVKQYSASDFEDLETKCQRLEAEKNDQNILIQNLKEENNRLKEELKPLYGGERNGWIKTIANFIGSNYDKLLNKKDTKDWVEEVYKDFENVESSTDIELYDITPEKSTLTKQLKMVQKYCKEHSKPSTKK